MQVGKSRVWLESGAQPHELADPDWLVFIGAVPRNVVVGVDPALGPDRTGELTLFSCGRGQQSFLAPTFKPSSTGAGLLDLGTDDPEVAQRAKDLRLLRALVDNGRDAFAEMLTRLEDPARRYETLTSKQRGWAVSIAERDGIDWQTGEDVAERNANVPRGREVQMAFDVDKRPLAPPGRKARLSAYEELPGVDDGFEPQHYGVDGRGDEHMPPPPVPSLSTVVDALKLASELPEGPEKNRALRRLGPLLIAAHEEGHWVPAEGVEEIAGGFPPRVPPGKKQHVELTISTGHPDLKQVLDVESITFEERAPSLPPILEATQPGPGERARRPVRRPRS